MCFARHALLSGTCHCIYIFMGRLKLNSLFYPSCVIFELIINSLRKKIRVLINNTEFYNCLFAHLESRDCV